MVRSFIFLKAFNVQWNCLHISALTTGDTGQFERTLIVAEEGSYVILFRRLYSPNVDSNQLHAAVVELVALDNAEIKYSTVQNWYAGDEAMVKVEFTTL